jgi:hypothetical protein
LPVKYMQDGRSADIDSSKGLYRYTSQHKHTRRTGFDAFYMRIMLQVCHTGRVSRLPVLVFPHSCAAIDFAPTRISVPIRGVPAQHHTMLTDRIVLPHRGHINVGPVAHVPEPPHNFLCVENSGKSRICHGLQRVDSCLL